MSNKEEFSLENSEELLANLKAGGHSDFEQLRSTLNLLGHVTELPPTSTPPVLPSEIAQPVPLLPMKSTKPRRTIVTSVIVTGILASASLAAAAVTGVGPAPIVNIAHQTAKFVKGVAGAVSHIVTGNPSDTAQNQATSTANPLPIPSPSPAPPNADENNQSDSEHLPLIIPAITNLFPPVSPESNSHENNSQKPNTSQESPSSSHESPNSSNENSDSSHDNQVTKVEDSPTATPKGDKEHSSGENQKRPSAIPSVKPSEDNSDENAPAPTPLDRASPNSSSDQPIPSPSPSDQSSEND